DLAAATAHRIHLTGAGLPAPLPPLEARTLLRPPGELLHRIATVSDTHIGTRSTGFLHTIIERPEPAEAHPVRCARAALREARAWGVSHLVVKGDLVDHRQPGRCAQAAPVSEELDVPISVVPGNHEWSGRGDRDPAAGLARHGLDL